MTFTLFLWLLDILFFLCLIDSMSWKWHSFFVGTHWNVIANEWNNLWESAGLAAEHTAKVYTFLFSVFVVVARANQMTSAHTHIRIHTIQSKTPTHTCEYHENDYCERVMSYCRVATRHTDKKELIIDEWVALSSDRMRNHSAVAKDSCME